MKGTLTIRTKGVGTVHIESASAILLDADGEEVTSYDTVDKDITILAPMSFTKENVKLTDATYAELSKAEEIKLVVDGDFPATYVIELDKNC